MHVRRQMKEYGFEQFAPTVIFEDNQAVKRLSEDVVDSTRTRHWDKEYHQIREEFERETIVVEYVNTFLNLADCLTKYFANDFTDFTQTPYVVWTGMLTTIQNISRN